MGKPHKHAALIKAWADGAEIQCKYRLTSPMYFVDSPVVHAMSSAPSQWETIKGVPQWAEYYEYRIKPQTVRFRNYLCQTPQERFAWVSAHQERSPLTVEELEKRSYFKGWIGGWQEIEVE